LVALEKADRAFTDGNYEEACRGYEEYLHLLPSRDLQDQVLFRLGLAYALKAPNPDWQRATTILLQVVDDYPSSPFRAPAELILTLRSEVSQVNADAKDLEDRIKQLTTELDRLKKIDSERGKRP
jgi:outer membrane protein assembly factor BamD (BamD/ComL family)